MVSAKDVSERIHAVLVQALSLSQPEFAANAGQLHLCVASVLASEASQSAASTSTSRSNTNDLAKQTRLAALAVFHKLSTLQNGIPITLVSLHDFIIVFTSSGSHAASKEERLARRVADSLFRKKPSLVRALETQLLPAWSEIMTSFQPSSTDSWLQEAKSLFASIHTMSKISALQEPLQSSSTSSAFWTALQSFYDIVLPKLLADSMPAEGQSVLQIQHVKESAKLRKEIVDFFTSYFSALSAETITDCLENEASNPDLPDKLTDLPLTSLINMTLLQDAEYYHGISRRVALRTPASATTGPEERSYLQNALDFGKTIPKDSVSDVLTGISKGKERASSNGHDPLSESTRIAEMTTEVLNILTDAAVQNVRRLLTSSALEQVADDQKVERVISMLLEGEAASPHVPADDFAPKDNISPSQDLQEETARKPSAFASVRRNVFNDTLDIARLHRGKQDFKNDTFLPSELRASILAAAERQAQESDEEDSDAVDDAFAEVDEDAEVLAKIKVKDDVSEESGVEEEMEGTSAVIPQARPASGTDGQPGAPSASFTLGATGVPKQLESLYMTTYRKDASVFTREAKKSPARAELKKRIAALRLPQSIADEQIEGWARMLERNPKKDKILERFNDKQFQGNEKGLSIKDEPSQGQANPDKADSNGGGGGSARGGHGERGRGRGRGRGGARQSDQRRRGHDRKMQKAGAI